MLISLIMGIGLGILVIRLVPEEIIDLLRIIDDDDD